MHKEILPLLHGLKQNRIAIGLISNCFSEEAAVIRKNVLLVCLVHLYTLEGAICNTEFNCLSKEKKAELKEFDCGHQYKRQKPVYGA